MHSNTKVRPFPAHASLEAVTGPFGPYQEIVAFGAYLFHAVGVALRAGYAALSNTGHDKLSGLSPRH